MLPNHAPLLIAEQFGTLETLYPGRIDLGVGRAPGTDPRTLRALRRDPTSADTFPRDVLELQALLGPLQPGQVVQAVPAQGSGFRSGSWARASLARNSPPCWACRMRSPLTSPLMRSCRRCRCSATIWMRGGRQSGCEPGVAAEVMMVALIDARKRVVCR